MKTLIRPAKTTADATTWTVTEDNFNPAALGHKETVFTLGNGYLGSRGTFEEGYPGAMPATLINGVYDDVPVVYTELANCPDWLPLVISVEGERFRLDKGQILEYNRCLNLYEGILERRVLWRSPKGHTVEFRFERFTSLADCHVMAIRCWITPIDFTGLIEVQSSINGYPDNQGVMHWNWVDQGGSNDRFWLHLRSRHSGIDLGMASYLKLSCDHTPLPTIGCQGYPTIITSFQGLQGETVTLEKIITVFTSRDTKNPAQTAYQILVDLVSKYNYGDGCYEILRREHAKALAEEWQACDITIEGDLKAQLAVRYNLFQILIAAPRGDNRVSIPAKTLSGFAYRGHVFWDTEIFIVPFLTYTQPELAQNLLTYRYKTLGGARRKAKEAGYEGAMYAWESAATGDEVTPRWIPGQDGQLIRIWCGDRELHITADVAYAVWHYWQATGNNGWMRDYGAEIILDTAVFWGSCVEWNSDRHCYELRNIIGPDENHEHIDNNAFTNRMVQWHLETAFSVLAWLRAIYPDWATQLEQRLNLSPSRLALWKDIIQNILILQDPKTGLIEQFEGFYQRKDVNLADFEPRTRSMQAILGIEATNERQILKQADVLMLLYLLRDRYSRETLAVNWDYYEPRTDHSYGSSLGPAIHAILACNLDKQDEAYTHFMRAALVDLEDVRRNADEGIHAASAGGIWQAVIFGFAGIRFTKNGPVATPKLPAGWTRIKFRLRWCDRWYEFDLKAMDIKGVIFDLDGVLTDTSEYHYQGWQKLADEEGLPFSREANEALRGLARRESLLHILGDRQVTEAEMQEMMARKNCYYLELIRNISPADLLPGVALLLDDLRNAGIKVGIGSASKNAKDVIESLGIADKVDAIADGYSVVNPKPAPDVFLHAAQQLGLEPSQCVVVEDAASGIKAAKAGGMKAVGLGPVERVGNADVVLDSLEGIRWADLLTKINQESSPILSTQIACDLQVTDTEILPNLPQIRWFSAEVG